MFFHQEMTWHIGKPWVCWAHVSLMRILKTCCSLKCDLMFIHQRLIGECCIALCVVEPFCPIRSAADLCRSISYSNKALPIGLGTVEHMISMPPEPGPFSDACFGCKTVPGCAKTWKPILASGRCLFLCGLMLCKPSPPSPPLLLLLFLLVTIVSGLASSAAGIDIGMR